MVDTARLARINIGPTTLLLYRPSLSIALIGSSAKAQFPGNGPCDSVLKAGISTANSPVWPKNSDMGYSRNYANRSQSSLPFLAKDP
jgi:hypothetical protein